MKEVIERIEKNIINGNWQDALEDVIAYDIKITMLKRLSFTQIIDLYILQTKYYQDRIYHLLKEME